VTRVVELDEWTATASEFAGGWSEYAAERERALRRQHDAHERWVGERERVEESARQRAQWVERATSQRRKKKTRDAKGQLERKLKLLDRERVEKPYEPWRLQLSLGGGRSGDLVVSLAGAVVERGAFRLGPVELDLRHGDRLAVVGPNGSGKSTLLAALLGRVPLAEGSVRRGPSVELGELEQGRDAFAGDEELLALFRERSGLPAVDARTLLAKFGLGADDVLRPARSLSPGERTRAALASFMARGVTCLVLDEPTNHLDLPAIEELEAALAGFEGTIVCVSHDRRFLERLAPTRTLELRGGRVVEGGAGGAERRGRAGASIGRGTATP
jgi:ATPase subunit of ABC transporter with duplicated ATPase domains